MADDKRKESKPVTAKVATITYVVEDGRLVAIVSGSKQEAVDQYAKTLGK